LFLKKTFFPLVFASSRTQQHDQRLWNEDGSDKWSLLHWSIPMTDPRRNQS